MAMKFPPLPPGQFNCIVADPPWRMRDVGNRAAPSYRGPRRANKHYDVLDWRDICDLPVESLAAPDAWLLLWIPEALRETIFTDFDKWSSNGLHRLVAKAWGFMPTGATLVWVKGRHILVDENGKETKLTNKRRPVAGAGFRPQIGLGHYTRNAHEICIICKRGRPKREHGGLPSVIFAPRTEHSVKPDAFYAWAAQFAAGPRIDLFGRGVRPKWVTWGLEATTYVSRCGRCANNKSVVEVVGVPRVIGSAGVYVDFKCPECPLEWGERYPLPKGVEVLHDHGGA